MQRSLRGRLIVILALLTGASIASGFVMLALFRQSTTAQIGQAAATVGQACGAIGTAYRFYTAGWHGGAPNLEDPAVRRDLQAVVVTALHDRPSIEGGLWQQEGGSLSYAFPTYEGSGPKTDLPQAELARIRATNQSVQTEDRPQLTRVDSGSQTLLIGACPVPGPIPTLTAWAMTRVHSFGGQTYQQLMAGLAILFAAVVGASALAAAMIVTWSRHVGRIEAALGDHEVGVLPILSPTGERELDRIVLSLNEAGQRLKASREQTDKLSRQIAIGERLAAVGRIAAGVAHEIRNPIAAMRLKAETALKGDLGRKDQALAVIVEQVDRLDHLVRRLLTVSERDPLRIERVAVAPFLADCAERHVELAARRGTRVTVVNDIKAAVFDPAQIGRAFDNLILNALQVTDGSEVRLTARHEGNTLVFAVSDEGGGPPQAIRDHLFDAFVTGRADGTGLGLSIVREIAEAHGGTANFTVEQGLTTFRITIPWQPS